jgi:choline kinase
MEKEMKTIILAAGQAKRLGPLTEDMPKALLKVKGITIIDYQLNVLEDHGIGMDKVYIVTGHKSRALKYLFEERKCKEIFNPEFDTKNNIYSLYLTKDIQDDLLIINCDVYFHPDILSILLRYTQGSVICVDTVKELGDEEMKVVLDDAGRLIRIGKDVSAEKAHGEYIGISKIAREDAPDLFSCMERLMDEGNVHYWYEHAFQEMVERGVRIHGVGTEGYPWIEIDTVEDYEKSQGIL